MLKRLVVIETRRLLGRNIVKVLLILPILPVIVATIIRSRVIHVFETLRSIGIDTSQLWLIALGATPRSLSRIMDYAASTVSGMMVLNIANFAWLVAIIFAAYLFASDVSSGRLSLLVTRPVSRKGIILAKIIAAYIVLAVLFLEAAIAAYASAYIMAGYQSMPWLVLVYAVLAPAASLPLLLVTSIAGLRSGKSGSTVAAGFVIYFVLSLLPLLVAIPYIRSRDMETVTRLTTYVNTAEPIHSFMLPRLALTAAANGLNTTYSPAYTATGIEIKPLLLLSAATTAAAVAVLIIAMVKYFDRLDLKIP